MSVQRQVVFIDPLPRIVEAVREVIKSLSDVVVGTEIATSMADAVSRLRAIRTRGIAPAIIAPRNAMPQAPVRDDFRASSGSSFADSYDALEAILARLNGTFGAPVPVIVPFLFVDDPVDVTAELQKRVHIGHALVAQTADITNVSSSLDHDAVVTVLRQHLTAPSPGVHRLDELVPRAPH